MAIKIAGFAFDFLKPYQRVWQAKTDILSRVKEF
jgi:hypothetical protein